MARTRDKEARKFEQCARGRVTRYISEVPVIIADARTNMTDPNHILADAIQNETANIGVFIAPCVCKVVRCYTNAGTYATCASGGTVTIKFTKAAIGASDVDLCATIAVSGETGSVPTAETSIDGTLVTTAGVLDLLEGQLVYAVVVVSNHNITDRTEHLTSGIEWVPTDTNAS